MRLVSSLYLGALLFVAGCDCSGPTPDTCASAADCAAGERCVDGRCEPAPDAAAPDDARAPLPDGAPACDVPCADACCAAGEVCRDDACVPGGAPCASDDECLGDSFCDETLGRCVPWDDMGSDPECSRLIVAGTFAPTVQCEFFEAPAGDAFPANVHVLTTPMVVDFRVGRAAGDPPRPSIVAVFDDGGDGGSERPEGVIRILDGATCAQQAELGSLQLVSHSSPPAVGDLDGDGRPEIVANKANGGLVAFTYDETAGAWTVLWRSTLADGSTPYEPTGSGWSGPSLYDLDDDGVPEVLRGGIVLDAQGRLIDGVTLGLLPYSAGIFAVVEDVDADGVAEFVAGQGVWQWNGATRQWDAEAYATGGTPAGHVALADFGDFPGGAAWPAETPEVAVVSTGQVRVQTLDGTIVFGPVDIPGGGTGGPPTVADFDGDGRPEVASAGANAYAVFDLDCLGTPIGECPSGSTTGVLWSQRSQDASSNVTGSSVFDFEGDGRAEVVYGDECFVRVYDGRSGDVIFSQSRSSCTWYENPVIADVDGDFNAEIVIGDNFNCGSADSGRDCSGFGLGARNTDPLFTGLRCAENADCLSGTCDAGFCRCTIDDECCSGAGCARAAFVCEAPPAGTPGSGNTCRASRPRGTLGIRVYADRADRWVGSRRIWNQHAYHVTNVNEDGTVPALSAVSDNWRDPSLNNFRQNVQGEGRPDAAPDLTSRGDAPISCAADGTATLEALVCNRGTEPVGDGLSVGFYEGDPSVGGARLCQARTRSVLDPGDCERVTCVWATPTTEEPGITLWVVPDDEGETGECREGNNAAVFEEVRCSLIE
ncbi:MAG: VCBS repeat-containing protein [Myxococcota bacterium]|nr:VCBS repeat-containing protein [Myxococcota bacterium]